MNKTPPMKSRLFEAMGIIVPAQWDPNGKPNAWAISTYDENYYQIDIKSGEGMSLGLITGRKIRIFGYLKEAEDGNHHVMVEKYMLLSE